MRRVRIAVVAAGLLAGAAAPAVGQRSVASERDTLTIPLTELQVMLDSARALYTDLQEDPAVLYYLDFGPPVEADAPEAAYPWNATTPTSDSTVNVLMPGNLREADRAYYNYAVMRMRVVRTQDPDAPCEELMDREEVVLSSFVDGWILARTLFGGPEFVPLQEFVFAREAGLLRPLLAARGDTSIGVCAEEWATANPEAIAAYEAWRADRYPGPEPEAEAVEDPAADS
jgi:hypothetical protein